MWDKRFGGTQTETLTLIIPTKDNGCLLGGYSFSMASGDKTQNSWGSCDYWIVKLDALGILQWEKDFGGDQYDKLTAALQTKDNGFIIGGYSGSGISGDKSEALKDTSGTCDFWILKIDSLGNKEWDKDIGGFDSDVLTALDTTTDGGYILGGYSKSEANGDKTEDLHDTIPFFPHSDFWIVKIDSMGNKQWDKRFGGYQRDELYSIHQTTDKGFICGGYIFSDSSFEVSQTIRDDNNPNIFVKGDYWIIKTDSIGNKQWDKRFGGNSRDEFKSMQITPDKGFVLGGYSLSLMGGDKSENNCSTYYTYGDYWVVKTDSMGNKIWDKSLGGFSAEDFFGNIFITSDSGILMTGTSYSGITCEKSETNAGTEQTWAIKIDSNGAKVWDKTLRTNVWTTIDDEIGYGIQTKDNCFVIGNNTAAPAGYDVSQNSRGSYDYWVEKFCPNAIAQFSAPNFLCPGTCVDFFNFSYNALTYIWSFPGATPDTSTAANPVNICYANPGSYDVQLIVSNSNVIDTLFRSSYITVYPSPPPQAIAQSGDTLFANQGATSYQWYFNGNNINGATDYFYVAAQGGDYNVVATDINGCEVEAAIFNIVAGLQSTVDSRRLTVFPNPAGDEIKIQKLQGKSETAIEISIYNLVGEKVMTKRQETGIRNQEVAVDVSALSEGVYFIEIVCGEKIFRRKFVKSGNR